MTVAPGTVNTAHTQSRYRVRFEWGLAGARAVTPGASIAVVVDLLSFTTALSVAIDAGMEVFPYQWNDASARVFARDHDATLALSRGATGSGGITLSAASIRAARGVERLVLPSPNGSTTARHLASHGATVLGACLRNRAAMARWMDETADRETTSIAVIAAGEKWPDGSLRPAIEDMWGAGGVIAALHDMGWVDLSPEARMAMASFRSVAGTIADDLRGSASGQELIDIGFGQDVDDAAVVDESPNVPILRGERFVRA
jgi:2-phosphosulfolactate phosphatase